MAPNNFLIWLPGMVGAVTLLLVAGCTPHPVAAPPPQKSSFQITLQMTPAKPRQLDPTAFTVQLTDRAGKLIPNAVVTADLAMPTMDMGRNSVVLNPVEPGRYGGTGRFTMAGSWIVTLRASRGKEVSQQAFPVEVL